MTVWILHLPMSAEEEQRITARAFLPLPFSQAPNLGGIGGLQQLKQLLQALHPDDPPETIHRKAAPVWEQYSAMQKDDLVAVPLVHRRAVAVAEVTEPYVYRGEAGEQERHAMQVQWAQKQAPLRVLQVTAPDRLRLEEVHDAKQRLQLRACLPYRYNRFSGWRWILVVFMGLSLMMLVLRMLQQAHVSE